MDVLPLCINTYPMVSDKIITFNFLLRETLLPLELAENFQINQAREKIGYAHTSGHFLCIRLWGLSVGPIFLFQNCFNSIINTFKFELKPCGPFIL